MKNKITPLDIAKMLDVEEEYLEEVSKKETNESLDKFMESDFIYLKEEISEGECDL